VGKGALLRAVPTRLSRLRQARVGTAHAIEFVARPSIVRRAPLPTLRKISLSRFSFHLFSTRYFLFASSYSLLPIRFFLFASSYSLLPIRHPDEGMAERR
jgi:hypothetical protein